LYDLLFVETSVYNNEVQYHVDNNNLLVIHVLEEEQNQKLLIICQLLVEYMDIYYPMNIVMISILILNNIMQVKYMQEMMQLINPNI